MVVGAGAGFVPGAAVVEVGGVGLVVLPAVPAAGFTVEVVVGAGVGFATEVVLVGAGGVDLVVLPVVAAAGLTVDAVVGAGVGFATDAVLVGAGGVDLVAVTDGLGTDVEVATGFDSGAAGAVLAVVAAVVGDVAATGLGTDVGLPDVPAVGAVVTGDFTLGNATAGFVCGAGGVDLPEDTVILGVTTGAGAAAAVETLPEPVETDPLPEFTDEPLPDGLGTELTLMGFRRIVPLEPPDAGS
ncbi:MAG: hypothetical protein ACK57O_12755 [Planctomyces sp.]